MTESERLPDLHSVSTGRSCFHSALAVGTTALCALGLVCPRAASAQGYTFTSLGPSSSSSSMAAGISGGAIVGTEINSATSSSNAVLWTGGTAASAQDLNPSSYNQTFGTGVSGTHTVGYGDGSATGYATNALLWTGSTASSLVNLNPTAFTDSYAAAVSGSTIAGYGDGSTTAGYEHALLWTGTTAGTAIDINPTGFVDSQALATTGANTVGYGEASPSNTNPQALLWTGTSSAATNLNPTGFTSSEAVGLSGGTTVGFGVNASGYDQAIVWTGATAATAINIDPTNFTSTHATSISGGFITGYGDGNATGGNTHALVWTSDSASSYIDVTQYLPASFTNTYANTFAVGVDANGNIVGYGQDVNNNTYLAFLLTPTSSSMLEPGSCALLGVFLGGAAIVGVRRRFFYLSPQPLSFRVERGSGKGLGG